MANSTRDFNKSIRKNNSLPKKGTERPTTSVESTRAVLMTLEYMLKWGWVGGINSSIHIATGDRLNAYVVLIKKNIYLYLHNVGT